MPSITITPNAIYAVMLALLLYTLLRWLDKHGYMDTAPPIHTPTPPVLAHNDIDFSRVQVDDVVTCNVVVKIGSGSPERVGKEVHDDGK